MSNKKWTKDTILLEALKYKTRKELRINNSKLFNAINYHKLQDVSFKHMIKYIPPSKEDIIQIAKKYENKFDFIKNETKILSRIRTMGFVDEFYEIMNWGKYSRSNNWSKEELKIEALKYKTRTEFWDNNDTAVVNAKKLGIYEEITSHMPIPNNIIRYSHDSVLETSKLYNDYDTFKNKERGSFIYARKHDILKEITSHMSKRSNKRGFDVSKPAILYYLSVLGGSFYKIGITNRSVKKRFLKKDLDNIKIVHEWYYENGLDAYNEETKIKKEFEYAKYKGDNVLIDGNTELFDRDILLLDVT